jgi:hypothetical protein
MWSTTTKKQIYTQSREDPWADMLPEDGKVVELRRVKAGDELHDQQCSACGERTKARQTVLALLTMDGSYKRAIIHLTCLELYLDELPDETGFATKRREKATAGLVALEKDLAAKAV